MTIVIPHNVCVTLVLPHNVRGPGTTDQVTVCDYGTTDQVTVCDPGTTNQVTRVVWETSSLLLAGIAACVSPE